MCRFTAYLGPPLTLDVLVTHPDHSLIHQSYRCREREQPLNGDGFGVSWYVPEVSDEPAVFREITPAWSNQNLFHLARVTRSGCCFAHVRAASPGLAVTQTNCHPFVHGPFSFMHNGLIPDFAKVKRAILLDLGERAFHAIRGTTDSEHLFAMFLDRHAAAAADIDGRGRDSRLAVALERTIADAVRLAREHGIEAPCQLNLAVTDGRALAVSRYSSGDPGSANSLYVHRGACGAPGAEAGRPASTEPASTEPASTEPAVIVSSERLGEDAGWERVPPSTLVVVDERRAVRLVPLGASA